MKRWMVLGLSAFLVLLCACARAEMTWETVDDTMEPAVSLADAPMRMVFDVPEQAELLGETAGWCAYAHPEGDYEIVARTIQAASLEEAVFAVSGLPEDELRAVLRSGAGGCDFSWYAGGEGRLCRAEILSDRDYYYALTFSVREGASSTYHSTQEQVFASFGLVSDDFE